MRPGNPLTLLPGDLRLRLPAVLWVLLAIGQITGLPAALVAAMAVLALYPLTGTPLRPGRLLHLEAALLLLFLTLPFTVPGTELYSLGPLSASAEGLTRAGILAAKVTASVLLLTLAFGQTEPAHLGAALHSFRVPDTLIRLLLTTARYLGLIRGEALRLTEAMRARGFRPGTNRHTWQSYGWLLGMLLVRALDRAERVEDAMRARGFSGRFPAPDLPRLAARDLAAAACLAITATLLTLWDRL